VKLFDQRYSVQEQIAMIVGIPKWIVLWIVGFEASGHGAGQEEKAGCCFKSSHGNY
jgi:hypothetical protein